MSETATFQVSGKQISLSPEQVESAVSDELPEPIHEHYVIVGGRRFPPKQVLTRVTGLDRADFTTHQARQFLELPGMSETFVRPVVPVQVEDLADAPQLCLVDTGATTNRFAAWLADAAGIDLADAPQERVVIGGVTTSARHARAALVIAET